MTVEEFMCYELPTADTFRQRLTKGEPLLTETDKDALSLPFENFYFASQLGPCQINSGYHDPWGLLPRLPTLQEAEARREERRAEAMPILEQGRNLLERLSGEIARLADTYGPEAKGLAFDFRGVLRMIDGADMEEVLDSLNSLFLKADEFSRRCFTGEARPETSVTATADKPAPAVGVEATPPKKSQSQEMEVTQSEAAERITKVLKAVEWRIGYQGKITRGRQIRPKVLRWKGGKSFMSVRQLRNIEKGNEGAELWKTDLRYPGRGSRSVFETWIQHLLPDLARYMVGYWAETKEKHGAASFDLWMRARIEEEHRAGKEEET